MSVSFTRRKMILAGGAALAAPMLITRDLRANAQGSDLSASEHAVSTIPGSDPRFGSAVEALFPGLMSDPEIQKIAPLAILIAYQEGPSVRAFSVSWEVTTVSGTYEVPLYFYVSLGSPTKGHILSALGSGRRNIIPRGQTRLVTPFFHWTSTSYQKNGVSDWKKALTQTQPGVFLVSDLPNATQIKVSLDGAVFSDWKLIGPDKHELRFRIRARRNAEHDEGLVVYRLMKSGAPDSKIIETLQTHASAPRSTNKNPHLRFYQQARKVHAQILLKAFQTAGRRAFKKALVRLKKQKKTYIKRLAE
jgi:hypothetical protein